MSADLLDELHTALTRYVIFPSPQATDAMTLWIAATHAQEAWEHAPRAAVISPEKRCGKSRLIDIAEATSNRSTVTVNISTAALAREISEEDPPSLFIDEADTIFGPKASDSHEDLRGIVNSGHQRGRPYIRYDITTRANEHLPTFAMAMLAGIGDLPDTIMDRSVVIRMRRRAPGERVDPYRTRRDRPALHVLRTRLHEWLRGHLDELQDAEPPMPVEDRAADTWEPLVAVADLAGGSWPSRVRRAALTLVAAESTVDAEASLGVRLLADIRDVFDGMPHVGFLPSAEMVSRLVKVEDAPWNDIGRDGLTQRTLATRLGPYGVKSRHNSAKTTRGYHLADFSDPFTRYLASRSVQASAHASDQGKPTDTSTDTTQNAIRPDTSPTPEPSDEVSVPDRQIQAVSDARTLRDGQQGDTTKPDVSECRDCHRPQPSFVLSTRNGRCITCNQAQTRSAS